MPKETVGNTEVIRRPVELSVNSQTDQSQVNVEVIRKLVTGGDLSGLNEQQQFEYYVGLCNELGLDPKTQPFSFITFQKKKVLYANRSCTDQLARNHQVTTETIEGPELKKFSFGKGEVLMWYAKVRAKLPNGRSEENVGTLDFQPNSSANDMMKVCTKAKRRAILSLLGLSMMDELETETVGTSQTTAFRVPENMKEGEIYGGSKVDSVFSRTSVSVGAVNPGEFLDDTKPVKVTVTTTTENLYGLLKDMEPVTQSKAVSMWLRKIEGCLDQESLDNTLTELQKVTKGMDKTNQSLVHLREAVREAKGRFTHNSESLINSQSESTGN